MQKYNWTEDMMEQAEDGGFYKVAEVDTRIDQLERALKSTTRVLAKMLSDAETLEKLACEAINEADKALAL